MPAPDLNANYSVGNGDVRLTVTIGDGQTGVVSVFRDGVLVARAPGGLAQLLLGPGPTLKGRTLHVRTIVNDVNGMTNKMSVSYLLTGGAVPLPATHNGEAANENDPMTFKATFALG